MGLRGVCVGVLGFLFRLLVATAGCVLEYRTRSSLFRGKGRWIPDTKCDHILRWRLDTPSK